MKTQSHRLQTDGCSCETSVKTVSMRGTLLIVFQALLWPAVSASALFTVNVEKSAYEAELHGDVSLVCGFSTVKRPSDLTVIWSRVNPKPDVDVYRLERGKQNHNYTSAEFIKRAQLNHEQLDNNRAVLHLQKLRIQDSGTYRCIVREGDEGDYKQITLNVTAPYAPVQKSIRKVSEEELELSCESQGFPLAQVIWSDGLNSNLTEISTSSTRPTDEDLFLILSKLTVKRDLVNNYTCSFLVKGETHRTASFSLPDELKAHYPAQYVWIGAVLIVLLAISFISIYLCRRRNGQKNRRNESPTCVFLFPRSTSTNTDSLLAVDETRPQTRDKDSEEPAEKASCLRDLLRQQHSQLYTNAETGRKLESFELRSKEGQSLNISSVLPHKTQTVLLLGEPGSGKSTLARILSSCVGRVCVVLLVDCSGAEGDFYQLVKSSVNNTKALDVCELRETLLGPEDRLLILDGYREGNKDLDETLQEFLTERQTCRVLATSRPGQCPALERSVRTVVQLIQRSEESGS